MTPAAQTSEPRTAAGRRLLDWLRFARKRTGAAGIPDIDAILAIEAEAATAPAAPAGLEVEAWVAGYVSGREEDQWRADDEIAERAVDAVCAIRMDYAAAYAEGEPEHA